MAYPYRGLRGRVSSNFSFYGNRKVFENDSDRFRGTKDEPDYVEVWRTKPVKKSELIKIAMVLNDGGIK